MYDNKIGIVEQEKQGRKRKLRIAGVMDLRRPKERAFRAHVWCWILLGSGLFGIPRTIPRLCDSLGGLTTQHIVVLRL